jgi:hypothetical protein
MRGRGFAQSIREKMRKLEWGKDGDDAAAMVIGAKAMEGTGGWRDKWRAGGLHDVAL